MEKFVYALAVMLSVSMLWAADAFTGTWKLNPAKSVFPKGSETKAMTLVMAEQGANIAVTAKGVGSNGKAISAKYSFPMKGGPVSYTEGGPAAGITVVNKRINANTFISTSTIKGKEALPSRAVVSKDGKNFTLTRTDGMEIDERQ